MRFPVQRLVACVVVAAATLVLATKPPLSRLLVDLVGDAARSSVTCTVTLPPGADAAAIEAEWRRALAPRTVTIAPVDGDPSARSVTVFGESTPAVVIALLERRGQLSFHEVVAATDQSKAWFAAAHDGRFPEIEAELDSWRHDDSGRTYDDYFLVGPDPATIEAAIAAIVAADPSVALPPGLSIGYERVVPRADAVDPRPFVRTYVIGEAVLDNRHIASAQKIWDPQVNRPEVLLEFTDEGARGFGELTAAITGQKLAIVLDGWVASAPVIQSAILGGRATITMGGGSATEQDAEADALVATLSGTLSALPPGIRAEPAEVHAASATAVWAPRVALAALAGALAWLLGWWLARSTALVLALPRTGGRVDGATLGRQLAVTVVVVAGLTWLQWRPLPLVDEELRAAVGLPRSLLRLGMLGLAPAFLAFVLVELFAAIAPSWRARRRTTPAVRAPLSLAVAIVTVVLAGLLAWSKAGMLQDIGAIEAPLAPAGALARIALAGSMVAGVLLAAIAAGLVDRHGLGRGWLVLFAVESAVQLWQLRDGRAGVLAIAAICAVATLALVGRRAPSPDGRRLPPSGVVPVITVATLLAFAALLVDAEAPGMARLVAWLLGLGTPAVLAIAVLLATVLSLRMIGGSLGATLLSIGFAALLSVLSVLPSDGGAIAAGAAFAGALAAVAGVELLGAIRRHLVMPGAVALVSVHDVELADELVDALRARDIPATALGDRGRALLRWFGAMCAVTLYVPADRADDARAEVAPRLDELAAPR